MAEKTLTYKQSHKLEERIKRVKEQLDKYPNMVPIIVERGKKCKLPQLDRIKFLVNQEFMFHDFRQTIMKKLNLADKSTALFMYAGQTLLNDDMKMQDLYEKYKDKEDGFLYMTYTDTETFGAN